LVPPAARHPSHPCLRTPAAAPDAPSGDLAAELTREALGDFAPALLLLPATERARVRALFAYACTLLGCAGEHGMEGERLARIGRWEADLERALGGEAGATPPICLRMARENGRRRWPPDALDELAACARQRVLHPRPASPAEAEAGARSLARAAGGALLEASLNAEVNGFGGALIRLHAVQHLGAALARGRCPLPEDEGQDLAGEALGAAVQRECARLRPRLLRAPRGLIELPAAYRRAGVFSLLAGLRLLSEIEEAGAGVLAAPPHLSPATRIGLLARARWFGLRFGLP
ncbi:MAG TPA: squalene/phytoene synthase family protein, partial [Thermoanaerobaculia bacterium]|nr:squalene/phytoene synthase family protein [Thermoanaerobaculia bacterium]